ncbi:hypothetical protein chiPu_0021336 [Chiloscyllium punctatum]|uniref:Uncharacterized protein n=1 Tax=Chiloscyllium punctatum TaxID=137246 RepID=A0A401RQ71_CHIPU|nr:hypothetical protein [Chiloscyllium punctatum]
MGIPCHGNTGPWKYWAMGMTTPRPLKYRATGILGRWNTRQSEYWAPGILGTWNTGLQKPSKGTVLSLVTDPRKEAVTKASRRNSRPIRAMEPQADPCVGIPAQSVRWNPGPIHVKESQADPCGGCAAEVTKADHHRT